MSSDWDEPLDELRWHWGDAYLIHFFEPGTWVAQRRDGHETMSAGQALRVTSPNSRVLVLPGCVVTLALACAGPAATSYRCQWPCTRYRPSVTGARLVTSAWTMPNCPSERSVPGRILMAVPAGGEPERRHQQGALRRHRLSVQQACIWLRSARACALPGCGDGTAACLVLSRFLDSRGRPPRRSRQGRGPAPGEAGPACSVVSSGSLRAMRKWK